MNYTYLRRLFTILFGRLFQLLFEGLFGNLFKHLFEHLFERLIICTNNHGENVQSILIRQI